MENEEIATIYRRLGPYIYRRCLKLLANPEEARDATQEVFVRLIRHAGRLNDDQAYLPWMYRVSTNYCLNQLRGKKRLEFHQPENLEPEDYRTIGRLEARNLIVILIAKCDDRTAQIAVHRFIDGMGQEEIAGVMNLSRRTVGKKLKQLRLMAQDLALQNEVKQHEER